MRIVYCGNFSQPHCTEVHLALTLEDLGHTVVRIQEAPENDGLLHDALTGADLFLFTRTWGNLITLDHLDRMRYCDVVSASYHLDLYVGLEREATIEDDPFWSTDFVFSPDGSALGKSMFEAWGINHYWVRPGVYRPDCYKATPDPAYAHDVVFVGSGEGYAHPEWPYRQDLVRWLRATFGDQFGKYGNPEPTVRGHNLNTLYASANVVVGDSLCQDFKRAGYWSDRVYETLGRGGFIIHPWINGMDLEFADGENIVFYDFNDWDTLKGRIDHFIRNAEEREAIRDRGHEFVKNNCTYHERLSEALAILDAHA